MFKKNIKLQEINSSFNIFIYFKNHLKLNLK